MGNSTIKLYQIIVDNSSKEFAEKIMSVYEESIKEQVKFELKDPIHELKEEMNKGFSDLREEMHKGDSDLRLEMKQIQVQTLIWIVSVGVLQLVAYYFLK